MGFFEKLFEPGKIGTKTLKNRVIMSPMQTFSYDPDGSPNQKTIDYFVARASGGVGLIICPGAKPTPEARVPGTPSLYADEFIPKFRRLTDAVHEAGCLIAQQINHTGKALTYTPGKREEEKTLEAIGPSPLRYVKTGAVLREATGEDIERLIEQVSETARRARDAGFDMVELHAAHGYLLATFLSPFTNRRTDDYGGTPEKRARFLCDLLQRTRQKVGPDYPILVRISGSEFLPGGTTLDDTLIQAPLLVHAGASAVHVSAGAHENTEVQFLSYLWPDAYITPLAAAVKGAVEVPVITVGKLGNPDVAEKVLEDGMADFISLGRPLLADPDWVNKVRDGSLSEIRRCLCCNNCWERIFTKSRDQGRLFCTVNPSLHRERAFEIIPASTKKKIAVVGGGLSGMEAARVAGLRGHRVTLYESRDQLGGQWRIASLQTGKALYGDVIRWLEQGLTRAEVSVKLNATVTPSLIQELSPDIVILAIGSAPAQLPVPGMNLSNVVQAVDVIQGLASAGDQIAVIGGRLIGMEVSLHLAEQGKRVSIITANRLGENGKRLEENIYRTIRDRLIARGVQIFANCPVLEVTPEGVFADDSGNLLFVRADTVVVAVGSRSRQMTIKPSILTQPEIYLIGDGKEPRDGLEALHEGAEVGRIV
jgi:2,4-dienoyl-CoA reductase-like NADH-dependent reductase (Old Yellow Enzyme family)/thioredoxin reductase